MITNPIVYPNIPRRIARIRLGTALTILGCIAIGWWLPIWFMGSLP